MCVHKIPGNAGLDLEVGIDTCDYEDLDNSIPYESGDLSVLQYNIRGLSSKIGSLTNLIDKLQNNGHPDIVLIRESWLKSNSPRPNIDGYTIERSDRKHKKGGGVCVVLSTRCKYKRRPDLEQFNSTSFESCFVEISCWNAKIVAGSIYRPPNTNPQEFIEIISKVISQAKLHGRQLILGMDHNLDLLKENRHGPTYDFLEAIYDKGLFPTITKPTRITTTSATLIDNILVDDTLYASSKSGIIIDDSSDHLPCYCVLGNLNPHRTEDIEISSRDTRKGNLDKLREHLKNENPLLPLHGNNTNEQFDNFHTKLTDLIDQYLPLTTRRIPHRRVRKEPWVSSGLLISINKNKKLYKKYLKNRDCKSIEETYKCYNQRLKRIKRAARKKYYLDTCEENKYNSKKLWKTINRVIHHTNNKTEVIGKLKIDGIAEHRGEIIVEEFARYFSTIGQKYATRMSNSKRPIDDYIASIPNYPSSIFLEPCTELEISKLIRSLKPKRTSGMDNIDNIILKELEEHLTTPLTMIFNNSLKSGTFPEKMKIAKVVPLHKSKSTEETNNYRPISLLLTLSKILEKIMYKRVYGFLTQTNQLYSSQYGFQKDHACDQAVGELVANITKGIEQRKLTAGIFLDLSKAFDSLEHSVIFKKLYRYGIRGQCLEWFKSYLTERKLIVSCKTSDTGSLKTSNLHDINFGTAQGSCLGPLIFLIFCNDLQRHILFLECIQFADDTTLYITHQNISYIRFCLEHDLNTLQDWFLANKLTLNVGKSVCILFGKHQDEQLCIKLGTEQIPQVTSTKFLGLWIDQGLSWNDHIGKLVLKLKSKLALLQNGKHFLSVRALRVLYFAQIHSNLTYGMGIWGSLLKQEQLHKLQKIQDHCMKIIGRGSGPLDRLYRTQQILTVAKQVNFELCKFWHKKTMGLTPPKLLEHMTTDHNKQPLTKTHRYKTRQKELLNRPCSSHREYHDSFLVKGNRIYSQIPVTIRAERKMYKFIKSLKQHLLLKQQS